MTERTGRGTVTERLVRESLRRRSRRALDASRTSESRLEAAEAGRPPSSPGSRAPRQSSVPVTAPASLAVIVIAVRQGLCVECALRGRRAQRAGAVRMGGDLARGARVARAGCSAPLRPSHIRVISESYPSHIRSRTPSSVASRLSRHGDGEADRHRELRLRDTDAQAQLCPALPKQRPRAVRARARPAGRTSEMCVIDRATNFGFYLPNVSVDVA